MISKVWLLNAVLVIGFIFCGSNAYEVWTGGGKQLEQTEASTKEQMAPLPRPLAGRTAPASTYGAVVERNLFSPNRKPPATTLEKSTEAEVKQVNISGRQLILYGVMVAGGHRSALISNPLQKTGEKPTMWIRAGDTIGNLRVLEILKDRVRLVDGGQKIDILLYDSKNNKTRETVGVDGGAAKPTVVVTTPEKQPDKPKVASPDPVADADYEIISTPFGPVKKKKQ